MTSDDWTTPIQPLVASGKVMLGSAWGAPPELVRDVTARGARLVIPDLPDFCPEGCYWDDCGHRGGEWAPEAEWPPTPFLARYAFPWIGNTAFGASIGSTASVEEAVIATLGTMDSYPFGAADLHQHASKLSRRHPFDFIQALALIQRCWITDSTRRRYSDDLGHLISIAEEHLYWLTESGASYAELLEQQGTFDGWKYDPTVNYFVRGRGGGEIALGEAVERDEAWATSIGLPREVVRWLHAHPSPGAYQ